MTPGIQTLNHNLIKIISSMLLLVFSILSLLSQFSESTTIVVDGVSDWTNLSVHIGDSIIFRPKNHYNLYIFRNQNAFNLCNFTEATILTNPNNTSYVWCAARSGIYYFTFHNGSLKSCNQDSKKLPINVYAEASPPSPTPAPAELPPDEAPMIPPPISGGVVPSVPSVPSSPAFPWPFQPREKADSPAPLPSVASSPIKVPDTSDGSSSSSMPFINSNPAVPLPTGEVDSTTIIPLPANGCQRQVAVPLHGFQVQITLSLVLLLLFMA